MDKYSAAIDKTLALFDALEEWADYIAFLSRLQKALQLSKSTDSLPFAPSIASKLGLCLSPDLPNGVHQKALAIYNSIFTCLSSRSLNDDLSTWLPGLLPLVSYASISVKSDAIAVLNLLLSRLTPASIHNTTKPLILSLLPALEDENSESFADIFKLLDSLKAKLNNDGHFWQCMYVSIISNPEKRLGALQWCNKRLPVFLPLTSEPLVFSDEATACLGSNPGLLVRTFASCLNTKTTFNPANDILTIRGYFDLLLSHLPLNSPVFTLAKDKQLLISKAVNVLTRKDMSLNRRLWTWLLGPDETTTYFQEHGLETLTTCLLELMDQNPVTTFKITTALVMDKWEISHCLIPRLLLPILQKSYSLRSDPEVVASSQEVFNAIEAKSIWLELILLAESDLPLLEFILDTYDVSDDEMREVHAPLCLLVLLNSYEESKRTVLAQLARLLVSRSFSDEPAAVEFSKERAIAFYTPKLSGQAGEPGQSPPVQVPYTPGELCHCTYAQFKAVIATHFSLKLTTLFVDVCNIMGKEMGRDEELIGLLTTNSNPRACIKLLPQVTLTSVQLGRTIKHIITLLWPIDDIKSLTELEVHVPIYYIEAAISSLLQKEPITRKLAIMERLWIAVEKPLFLILDEIDTERVSVTAFVNKLVKGNSNRLLKILTNPLLEFEFGSAPIEEISKFEYYLKKLYDVLRACPKLIKECSHEFAVVTKLSVVKEWDISTYKSLILALQQKFLALPVSSHYKSYSACVGYFLDIFAMIGTETEFPQYFDSMVEQCKFFLTFQPKAYEIELIQCKFIETILHILLDSVNWTVLVPFLVQGIGECQYDILLEQWMNLLIRTVYFYNEDVFEVLPELTHCLLQKLQAEHDDILINGLEDVLSISHSYLQRSKVNTDNGLKGIFQIESPANKIEEQNKLNVFMTSLNDTVKVVFALWRENTLKFKCKKLLEHLMDLERQEIIESLIRIDKTEAVKILNVLDGGRCQVTLPHIFNAIHETADFLVGYFEFMDKDSIIEIWPMTIAFYKNITAHLGQYKKILPSLILAGSKLALKTDRREIRDINMKLISGIHDDSAFIPVFEQIMPYFGQVVHESDISTAINVILANIHPKNATNLLYLIGKNHQTKQWKLVVNELFMSAEFFNYTALIQVWITLDPLKFGDLLSHQTIFLFNEKSEVDLKRICYLILIQPKDFFLTYLDELFLKLKHSSRHHVNLLLRIITLKFNEMHLLSKWNFIISEIIQVFDTHVFHKSLKELTMMNSQDLQLVLFNCKLVDQLLLLQIDEFNLQDWLFINFQFDVSHSGNSLFAIIDKISQSYDLTLVKDSAIKVEYVRDGKLVPLLDGVRTISSISNLRTFFESLSYLAFERVYGLYETDGDAVEADVLGDLVSL